MLEGVDDVGVLLLEDAAELDEGRIQEGCEDDVHKLGDGEVARSSGARRREAGVGACAVGEELDRGALGVLDGLGVVVGDMDEGGSPCL
jgi:hypothetical protein